MEPHVITPYRARAAAGPCHRVARAAAVLAVAALAVPAGAARAQTATGDIRGRVVEQIGGPLAGVTIVITDTSTGVDRRTRTDPDGIFAVAGLPPGRYEITAALEGFASQRQEGVLIGAGQAVLSNLELRRAVLPETLSLAEPPAAMDPLRTATSTLITSDEIDGLPLASRDPLDLGHLARAAGRDGRGGGASVAGFPDSANRILLDGVEVPFAPTGASDGRDSAHAISRQTLRSLDVTTAGAPAAYGGAIGATLAGATPSGSRRLAMELFEHYRPSRLRGELAEPEDGPRERRPSHAHQFGGTVGGPLAVSRHFFFVAYDGLRERTTNLTRLTVPDGLTVDPLTAEGLARVRDNMSDWPASRRQDLLVARTTHVLGDAHQLSARYSQRLLRSDGADEAGPRLTFSAAGPSDVSARAIAVNAGSELRPDLYNELRVLHAHTRKESASYGAWPHVQVLAAGSTLLRGGGRAGGPVDLELDRFGLADTVTWIRGAHLFDGGFDLRVDRQRQRFENDPGAYVFRSPASFATGTLSLEGERYTRTFLPSGSTSATSRPRSDSFGFFVQDSWRPADSVTLDVGLRYDVQRSDEPGLAPPVDIRATGYEAARPGGDADNWAPRIGAAWMPLPRYVARAAYDVTYGSWPTALLGAAQAYNGRDVLPVSLVTGSGLLPAYPETLDAMPVSARPTVVAVERGFEAPVVRRASASIDWEWMRSTSISVTYLNARGHSLPVAMDVNGAAPQPLLLTNAESGATVLSSRLTGRALAAFDRVVLLRSTGESRYQGVTVEMRRRLTAGFDYRLAYTTGRATATAPAVSRIAPGTLADRVVIQPGTDTSTEAANDQRHRFLSSLVIDTDNLAERFSGVLETILEDWRVGAIYTLDGGRPFSAYVDLDLDGDGNAFNDIAPGTARHGFRSEREGRLDARLARDFEFGRARLEAALEVLNALNAAHYRRIEDALYTVGGSQLTPNPQFGRRFDAREPRVMQFGVSVRF